MARIVLYVEMRKMGTAGMWSLLLQCEDLKRYGISCDPWAEVWCWLKTCDVACFEAQIFAEMDFVVDSL